MKKQFTKSFVLIVTMEYENVQASVFFSPLIIGPGIFPGLCNRPIPFLSSHETSCMSKTGQDCFALNSACRINKERHSEKVVVVAKDEIRFEAFADSFSKVEMKSSKPTTNLIKF
jgi:hypothetical protein